MRALVVDDTPTTRLVHTQLLRQAGLECDAAGSGSEALEMLTAADRLGRPFHLLMVDMVMPEMDGFQLMAEIRLTFFAFQPEIWLVTALSEDAVLEKAYRFGVNEVISKPLSKKQLHDALLRHQLSLVDILKEQGMSAVNTPSGDIQKFMQDHHPDVHVLLAEDEPINQDVARFVLEDIFWTLDVANNGQEAIALAQQNAYDLILMDMQMPIMGGVEATRVIRAMETHQRTPIIAMTANVFAEDRAKCLDAGMNDFVTKPTEPERLYKTLHYWLENRRDD